jgi:hypothetical protein
MNTSSVRCSAILKLPMLAAVDLDQLADAVASGVRLMDAFAAA